MSNRKILAFFGVASWLIMAGGCATAPEKKVETEGSATVVKETGPGENVKTTTVTGIVTKYEAGNELEIKTADGNSMDFDLEDSVRIEGVIEIGKPATVVYTDREGKKFVTIITSP